MVTIVATESQAVKGLLERQPFVYADSAVEDLLGTDIIAATAPLRPGDRVLVISPKGATMMATVVQNGQEMLVTA